MVVFYLNIVFFSKGYLGCYNSDKTPGMTVLVADRDANMTIEYCSALCSFQNYAYAGLQARYNFDPFFKSWIKLVW